MTVSGIFTIIMGVLEFPKMILEFINLVKKTPEEKHEEILKAIQAEAKKFDDTGRPSWG